MIYQDSHQYPLTPGSKGGDTSEAAAAMIAASVTAIRMLTLRTLARLGAATVLETVAQSGLERWTIAPRMSELRALGLIEDIGVRRRNPSGASAKVWQVTPAGHKVLAIRGAGRG